jgi:anti-sigma factor RsiW
MRRVTVGAGDEVHDFMALGLYVLGSLDDMDASAIERHLLRCRACRAEYDRLVVLPALLDFLADDMTMAVEAPFRRGRDARRVATWWRCEPFRM